MFRIVIYFISPSMNMHSGRKLLEVRDLKNIVCLFVNEPICDFLAVSKKVVEQVWNLDFFAKSMILYEIPMNENLNCQRCMENTT